MLIAHIYALVLDCTRMCENGGTLDMENCTCNCTGGFSGDNCERECIVRRLAPIDVLTTCNSYSKCALVSLLLELPRHRAPEVQDID